MNHTLKVAKYQLQDSGKAMLIYYLIMASLLVLLAVLIRFARTPEPISTGGLDLATIIFLFIAGLGCFKSSFRFTSANGVSRRRFFRENIPALLALAGLATVVDTLMASIYRTFLNYISLHQMLYPTSDAISGIIWLFAVYAASIFLGWFITLLYYRSSKPQKLMISLSPVVLFIGFGFANTLTSGRVSSAIQRFFLGFWGTESMTPYAAVMNLSITIVLLCSLIFLLVRRAPVKS